MDERDERAPLLQPQPGSDHSRGPGVNTAQGSPRQVSLARLAEFGIKPKHRLGQNFLIDDNILRLILDRLEARPDDVILEVGAGLGVLTKALSGVAAAVHAFEIDRQLEAPLRATMGNDPRVRIYFEDVLQANLEHLDPPATLSASNLPYSVAAPFLAESLSRLPRVRRYVVMTQREIADRLAASPGGKVYGAVSVWIQLHARILEMRPLSRAIFFPRPNVDSSLVVLVRHVEHELVETCPGLVHRVVEAAFAQRRKSLVNSLSSVLGADKRILEAKLRPLGLASGQRAEQVTAAEFVGLAYELLEFVSDEGRNTGSCTGAHDFATDAEAEQRSEDDIGGACEDRQES